MKAFPKAVEAYRADKVIKIIKAGRHLRCRSPHCPAFGIENDYTVYITFGGTEEFKPVLRSASKATRYGATFHFLANIETLLVQKIAGGSEKRFDKQSVDHTGPIADHLLLSGDYANEIGDVR